MAPGARSKHTFKFNARSISIEAVTPRGPWVRIPSPHIFEELNSLDLSPVLGANMQKIDFIKYVAYNFTGAFKPVDLETEVTLPFFL